MKILKATKENEQYYSPDFIRGYNLGATQQAEIMPERNKGHWILSDDREWKTCSKCGAEVDVSMGTGVYVNNDEVNEMCFCPNCGTHMRGKE